MSDKTGFAARLAIWGSVAVSVLAILGGIYSIGQTLGHIEDKLDRNCRILAAVDARLSFLVLAQTNPEVARDLRRALGQTTEMC